MKGPQNKGMTIIPRHLTLWIEENELRYKATIPALSIETLNFLKYNEDFFRKIISEKAVRNIIVYPLTYNQKAFWFFHKVNPNTIAYNIAVAGKIKNPFNSDIFKKALTLLTSRHILLRTIFADIESPQINTFQIVLDHSVPFIEEIDVSQFTPKDLDAIINRKYQIPFNLEVDPLFKTYIFSEKSFTYFLFNIHHIICDAWSLKVLFKEMFEIYDSLLKGKEPDLKPISVDYGDYIFYLLDFLGGESGDKQINYWTNVLKDSTNPLILPYDFDCPEIQTSNGSTYNFNISNGSFRRLNKIADKLNVTPNVILFTLFELLLSKLSLQRKFNIGIPASARTGRDYVEVFGHIMNVLPVACSLNDKNKLVDYILENKFKLHSAFENQDVPFTLLVEIIAPHRDQSRTPVFQVLYNFMNRRTIGQLLDLLNPSSASSKHFGTLEIYPVKINDQEGQFDLTLEILHNDTEFSCSFKYNSDLFRQDTIQKFESEYNELLSILTYDPEYIPEWLKTYPETEYKEEIAIKIAGTFTMEPICPFLNFWMKKIYLNADIECLGYNQIFQQLINPHSDFNRNPDGFNIALVRTEDWIKDKLSSVIDPDFSRQIEELESAVFTSLKLNKKGRLMLVFCPFSYILLNNKVLHDQIVEIEKGIIFKFQNAPNVFTISSRELIETYSLSDYYEPLGEEQGHIPYKEDFFISLATILTRKINTFFSLPIKAIMVDCDDTLWQGVVAEVGPEEVYVGDPEKALQKFLVEQYTAGILICLCSKNNENDVFEVFDKNNSMILHKEQIAFHRINWKSKSENLLSLSEEIKIGTDSFVYIDDNVIECEDVKTNLPSVLTIRKPENDTSAKYLHNSWIFDRLNITEEDKVRTKLYKEESNRVNYRSSSISYKDFINGLNTKIDISEVQTVDIPRISQLTYRTNQFNFTTIRRDEREISNLIKDSDYEVYMVRMSDRFGDYGIVGVIIINKKNAFTIETFLLSCRILGKGVEYRLISSFGEKAKENGYNQLIICFRKTVKNTPAQKFLESNFGNFGEFINDNWLYRIPTKLAIKFRFNPENYTGEADTRIIPDSTKIESNTDAENRNYFHYTIIEKYLNLNNIRKEIKAFHLQGKIPSKTDSFRLPCKTEGAILSVWKEILNLNKIELDDKFFEIGGHSILVPEITIRLQKEYGIKIKIVDVFQYPTIKELAGFVDSKKLC